jgi:hypothetical protein
MFGSGGRFSACPKDTESTEKARSIDLSDLGASVVNTSCSVIGQSEDFGGARERAPSDRYDFQWWVLPLFGVKAGDAEKGFYHSPGFVAPLLHLGRHAFLYGLHRLGWRDLVSLFVNVVFVEWRVGINVKLASLPAGKLMGMMSRQHRKTTGS